MAWNYAIIVFFDFMLGPILLGIYSLATHQPYIQWQPLTIQGGGMFHIAMGAVIGVSAWSRGQEKINGSEQGPMPSMPNTWDTNPKPVQIPSGCSQGPTLIQHQFGSAAAGNFNQPFDTANSYAHSSAGPQINISLDTAPAPKTKTGFPRAKKF